ncbi:hypothetical protein [Bradyrhizobium sp. CCBAU 21362]|uniref:hypothetical protein n=1 Tax=Bradyrhizobium sp. CCBAU 21362 TaxID=1325082 RepID=UPI002304E9FA|nr:hypothetical protein [Bradyrhizobium sp. CCBAU 21362]
MEALQDFSFSMKVKSGSPIDLFKAINYHHANMDEATTRLRLVGRQADGTEWHCGWTMPEVALFGSLMVEGQLTDLMIDQQASTLVPSTELVFYADHIHPLARVMGTNRIEKREIEVLGSRIEFAYERNNKVISITAAHSDQLPPTYTERWLTEPLRIMFGQPVVPRLVARNNGGPAIVFITKQPRLDISSWSSYWRDETAESFFDVYSRLLRLVALAPERHSGEPNQITRFYDELSKVAGASRWVIALTLAGCTEGLATLVRPHTKNELKSQERADQKAAAEFAEKIDALDAPDKLKTIAIAALRPKGASTDRTLKALAEAGCITREQLLTWRKLRNSVMHGEILYPYRSAKEDAKLLQLMEIVRSLTIELLKRREYS